MAKRNKMNIKLDQVFSTRKLRTDMKRIYSVARSFRSSFISLPIHSGSETPLSPNYLHRHRKWWERASHSTHAETLKPEKHWLVLVLTLRLTTEGRKDRRSLGRDFHTFLPFQSSLNIYLNDWWQLFTKRRASREKERERVEDGGRVLAVKNIF